MNILPVLVSVLLVIPIPVRTSINIDIIASEDTSERQVHVSGNEVNIISDQEIQTFKVYDKNLKDAVEAYIGAKPDDVFLKSPTPWNDLYKTFGWQQVNRILKPIRAKMLNIKYSPTLITTQVFKNPSSKVASYQAHLQKYVEDTVASMWEINGELATSLNISYGIDFFAMGVSGKGTMTYTSRWGENVMKSQTVGVGSTTGLEITLQPNQSAKAELYATRGGMTVQVDYEAILDGTVAVNFNNGYKGHHFFGLDINSVLNAGKINTSVFSSENITLGYYSDSEVVVRDYDTNDTLYFPNIV